MDGVARSLRSRRMGLLAAALTLVALSASAATIWLAETNGTLKVSALDGAFLLELPELPFGTAAAGVDPTNGNIWTYGDQRLRAFDREGDGFLDLSSELYPLWDSNIDLVVDGNAGNVWLVLGTSVTIWDRKSVV